MKQFLRKTIYFTLLLIPVFYIKPLFLLTTESYKETVAGKEIYVSIEKSKQISKVKTVLLGDSVGKQLFDNNEDNDSIYSLACNQAISVVGQYLLLNNFINTGNTPKIVYMLYSPLSFKNNLSQVYTFHYFLKPFNTKEYSNLFSNEVNKQINKIPYSFLNQEPYILTSDWTPESNSNNTVNPYLISPISLVYLDKIKELCSFNNIEFYIVPTPTKKSNKIVIENLLGKNQIYDNNNEKELNVFF